MARKVLLPPMGFPYAVEQWMDRGYLNILFPRLVSFVMRTPRLALNNQNDLSCIGNMDETPLWIDMPGDTTVKRQGMKSIPVCLTGYEKVRLLLF